MNIMQRDNETDDNEPVIRKNGGQDITPEQLENDDNYGNKTIHIRIFLIIILTAFVISIIALATGAVFLTNSISSAVEADMLVAVDIASQYVAKDIDNLKLMTSDIAKEIKLSSRQNWKSGIFDHISANYPVFKGFAVFDQLTLIESWGEMDIPNDLPFKSFMQIAYQGRPAISNTMYTSDKTLVMYISAPIDEKLILVAALPGFYFAELCSQFIFWESGHLIINDEEGTVISSIRPNWVQDRNNFFAMAREDSVFDDLAEMTTRAVAGERGIAHYSIDHIPRISAFRPLPSATEKWFIGIVAPSNESAVKSIPHSLILMGFTTFILSIAAAVAAAMILRRPYDEAFSLRKDAEVMSMSKSVFLANMSHEIRTPMNSIVGFSELALDGDCTPRTRDYLDKIKVNAQWLLQIINDILDISKVESGKMELENIPFDMHELISGCRTLIMPNAIEKGITLYFYAEPSTGKRPLGDPSRLRQVFINLLSNAVKFTNTGMVKLHAALIAQGDKTITMHFEVKDSGIGMTKGQISKIFDPFTQAETGITRKYGGTGLGLSITRNIIEMMGGVLTVESTPGIGSKFSFDLTFDTVDITDDEMFEKKIVLNEIEKPTFEGEVLLCEDNPMNQQVICEHLSRVGLKTVIADNGQIGLDFVRLRKASGEKQFSLIFMDIHMPVMDGLEAASKIQDLKTGIPIVAMTANIMTNDKDIYRANGMFDCVGKPFTSQELWRCLMKYLTPITRSNDEKNFILEADAEFQRMLQVYFVKSNQNKVDEIRKAIEEGDIELAHRIAHTLKGNAGQLGKTILQKAATDVEKNLKHGKNHVTEEQLQILEVELNMVLNEYASKME